jgi:hypothetical protein
MKGWFIIPNTGSPNRVRAISVPQAGMPEMKDLVPSIGSSTQTYSASGRSGPNSSPTIPCSGKVRRIRVRIAVSAAWSAAVTGSNWLVPLSVTFSAVRKNGRMVSPAADANSSTKAVKSIAVMVLRYCDGSPPRRPQPGLKDEPRPPFACNGLFANQNFPWLISCNCNRTVVREAQLCIFAWIIRSASLAFLGQKVQLFAVR